MSKTLGRILTVVAAIAVNVIPGVGQFLSAAIGATLATAVISAVTLAGLQASAGLLGLGPGSPKPETTETAIKTSRPPRVSAYGRSRLYGAYALYETAANGTAVDIYAVHDGAIDGIEQYYLGDEAVTLAGSAVVAGADGRYAGGAVNVYATDGSIPGAGFPAVSALLGAEWDGRGDGVVAIALTAASVKAKDFQATYPQGQVPVPSIVARWQKCPDPAAVDPLDESGWTWTESPVRQLLHYKLVREGPRPALPRSNAGYAAALAALRAEWWAARIAPTLDYWITAAADCDAPRALKAGGSEPRYRSAVAHKHTDDHKGPVAALLGTFDGWLCSRSDGALILFAGKYVAPSLSLGPDAITSFSFEGTPVDDDEAVNEIICSYISAEHDYNTVECDAWRDESDISARGQVLGTTLEAPVPSNAQSRYLAKRLLARKNAPARGTVTTTIAGRAVRGHRFIDLHLEESGAVFYSGPVEIVSLSRALRGGVTFGWVAADPTVDAWNPATEEGEPAAKGNRIASLPLDPPVIESATLSYAESSGAGVAGATIAVVASTEVRGDLTWFLRWRTTGSPTYTERTFTGAAQNGAGEVTLQTDFVASDVTVEVGVSFGQGDGRISPWADTSVNTSPSAAVYVGATNLAGSPEAFGSAPWAGDGANAPTVMANVATGPYGLAGADLIHFDRGAAAAAFSRLQQTISLANGNYEFGVWLRADDPADKVALRFGSTNGAALNITTVWQRFTMTGTVSTGTLKVAMLTWEGTIPGTTQVADVYAFGAQVRAI